MIGKTLAHYKIIEKIGSGGMGEVYRASDSKLGREVALKILPPAAAADPERRQRFEREAKAVASLQHPHIVTIFSIEEAEGTHFFTMEIVRGKTLNDVIPTDGVPLDQLFEIGIPLADAVHAGHERGVIHRDLKPGNVMVDEAGHLKVLDFGLAKLVTVVDDNAQTMTARDSTQEGRVLGTVAYMSPEQAEGKELDRRSDIFSLGVLLYEAATGKRPFTGDTPISMMSAILRDTPPSVTSLKPLPRHLGRIIQRCLEKSPDKRFQTARDVCNELEGLKREVEAGEIEPLSGTSEGISLARVRSSARRMGLLKWIGGIVVAAAATAAVFYAIVSSRSEPDSAFSLRSRPLTSAAGVELAGSWSPDGSFFAYSHSANGPMDIFIRSTAGGDPVRLVESPSDDVNPAWSPDNRWIAFAADREGSVGIYLVPPLGGDERLLVETGLAVMNQGGDAIGTSPWSPDGKRLTFSRRGDGRTEVWTVDLTTGTETQITTPDPGVEDQAPVWSHDGETIAFIRLGSPWIVPASGGEPRRIPTDGMTWGGIGWSPDDKEIVFVSECGGGTQNLWSVEVSSGTQRQLTFLTNSVGSLEVGRDGRILYSDFSHQTDLFLQDLANGDARRLTFHTRTNFASKISPDGTRVAYQSDRTGNVEIWVLALATGKEHQLTNHEANDTEPSWSADGQQLAFVSDRTGSTRIWIVNAAGGAARPLIEKDGAVLPQWSPDGRSLGYLGPSDQGYALWLAAQDGSGARKIIDLVSDFAWYRDTKRVICSSDDVAGEIRAIHLETGREVLLFEGPHIEIAVDLNGQALTYCAAMSHSNLNLHVLWLEEGADGLPRATGPPEAITAGDGLWHVHNGGWSPDGRSVVYTRDTDTGDVHVLEGAF
jgi:Tol biopolymer transport system component